MNFFSREREFFFQYHPHINHSPGLVGATIREWQSFDGGGSATHLGAMNESPPKKKPFQKEKACLATTVFQGTC